MYEKLPIDLFVHLHGHVPSAKQIKEGMHVLREQGVSTNWVESPADSLVLAVQTASTADLKDRPRSPGPDPTDSRLTKEL